MSDWMTIRVELLGQPGEELDPPPGRLLLVHADHTFSDFAEAVDIALGRWDLTPLHEFVVDDRRLLPGGDPDDPDADDSEELTLGECALRPGTRFGYTFDLGERWLHACTVEQTAVEAAGEDEDEPEVPVPIFGWGTLPDQYGRVSDSDEDDDAGDSEASEDTSGSELVRRAIAESGQEVPTDELAAVAARLRSHAGLSMAPYDRLFAAAGVDPNRLPADDQALLVALGAGLMAPGSAGTDPALDALDDHDWAAVVVGLVRGDVGQSAEPEVLLSLSASVTEVQRPQPRGDARRDVLKALRAVVPLWQTLGILDDDRRLTAVGRWSLPQALRRAHSGPRDEFDDQGGFDGPVG